MAVPKAIRSNSSAQPLRAAAATLNPRPFNPTLCAHKTRNPHTGNHQTRS